MELKNELLLISLLGTHVLARHGQAVSLTWTPLHAKFKNSLVSDLEMEVALMNCLPNDYFVIGIKIYLSLNCETGHISQFNSYSKKKKLNTVSVKCDQFSVGYSKLRNKLSNLNTG